MNLTGTRSTASQFVRTNHGPSGIGPHQVDEASFFLRTRSVTLNRPAVDVAKKKPLPDLAAEQGLIRGWEFATLSFPLLAIRRLWGLPASRRYSPWQAESSAS